MIQLIFYDFLQRVVDGDKQGQGESPLAVSVTAALTDKRAS